MKIRDVELELHPDEDLSNAIRRDGDFFEAHILDYLRDNFKSQKTVLDIGANIGNHTTYFAEYLDCDLIYAYEPIYANFLLLLKNTIPYKNTVVLGDFALSDYTGQINMSIRYNNMGASEVNPEGITIVPCYPLDAFAIRDVTLLKLDVEWHEPAVLRGAEGTIQRERPLILIEDTNEEYAELLPDYELVQGWREDKTYLYRWK